MPARTKRPRNPLPRHPVLGQEVDQTTGRSRCSRCNEPMPEDTVPLMLFGPAKPNGDCMMWIYCATCSRSMIPKLVTPVICV